jgi:hypothetical protein
MTKIKYLLIFFILLTTVGVVVYFTYFNSSGSNLRTGMYKISQRALDANDLSQTNAQNHIPDLYSDVQWSGPTQIKADSYEILIVLNKEYIDGKWQLRSESIPINGSRWEIDLSKSNQPSVSNEILDYYEEQLVNLGWSEEPIRAGNYEFTPMIADGPMGSVWGYLRMENGIIQEFILSELSIPENNTHRITIYVSDPMSMTDLLK